jgi:hypothetical protein
MKGCVSVNNLSNLKKHLKSFKTTSGSYSKKDLSNIKTFSPSQSHATVPLNHIDTLKTTHLMLRSLLSLRLRLSFPAANEEMVSGRIWNRTFSSLPVSTTLRDLLKN